MRGHDFFEGCYDAGRAGALAGVPVSTVYDWARKDVVVPSVSLTKPMLWSYADLMALRIVYWLRHPKGLDVPASSMPAVKKALKSLAADGVELWSAASGARSSPLLVDRGGSIYIDDGGAVQAVSGQGVLDRELLQVLGPFDTDEAWGPDLVVPMPHLRIVPGKVSGEPHLFRSRLTTTTVAALASRGFDEEAIRRLYPHESPEGLVEAVDLEQRLAA